VDVIRDLLDTQVRDRQDREMGRVDGVEIECRAGDPPRVTALLVGPSVLAARLHPAIGRWVGAVGQALGLADGRPVRIDPGDVRDWGGDVETDVLLVSSPAGNVERWLRRWLRHVPGGG
jgi:hypothetical protein